jgi:hypothetical protein
MSKSALGKGLGPLMNGDVVAGERRGAAPKSEPLFGRGLSTLVSTQAPPFEQAKERPKHLLPPWFFFAADILLLAYSVTICFDAPNPLTPIHVLFCGISITLGAALAIVGVFRAAE